MANPSSKQNGAVAVWDTTGAAGNGEYVVKDGDSIESIASEAGLFWETVWNHPSNSALRKVRDNPRVLMAGDRVTVPPLRPKTVKCETGREHVFRRNGVPALIRFRVVAQDGTAFPNREYRLKVGERTYQGTTDADATLQEWVTPVANTARLTVWLATLGYPETAEFPLAIGALEPVETARGIQARLSNLCYPCGVVDGRVGPITRAALRTFQRDHGLADTGEPDDATRDKLEREYGA